jgi:hypothetical protein
MSLHNMTQVIKSQDNAEIPDYGDNIIPELSDNENYRFLERHLFHEMTTNITYGFEESSGALNLAQQKAFFERTDVRDAMRRIIVDFLKSLREDEEWEGGMMHDWIREYIYDQQYLAPIYDEVERTTNSEKSIGKEHPLLSFDEYQPIFI